MIRFDDNKPIYIQIADDVSDLIVAGEYGPEGRIPSVRDLAARYQVNANTAMRAVEHLQSLDIIYNRRGIGYFVAPDATTRIIEQRREQFLSTEISYFFGRLELLGYSPDEIKSMYQKYIDKNNQ